MDEIKVASISMNSSDNKEENIKTAQNFIQQAVNMGAQWVVLPEVFSYIGDKTKLFDMAEEETGALNQHLSDLSKNFGIYLFAGTVVERPSYKDLLQNPSLAESINGVRKVFNTMYVFNPQGQIIAKYRKIHLFDLYGESGEIVFSESSRFLAGDRIVKVEVEGWTVGLVICFDIRFSEMFLALAKDKPVDAFIVPAAFTYKTGKDHWELLLRYRAIEGSSYVIAANQVGKHANGAYSYGHSMIIDPWGIKLCDTNDQVGIGIGSINKQRLYKIRSRIPIKEKKRMDIYG